MPYRISSQRFVFPAQYSYFVLFSYDHSLSICTGSNEFDRNADVLFDEADIILCCLW